ncbi:MAG: peptidase M22 [Clostridia bacterium]|nr:peptidase M22 [Clostridia bacterium]
MSGCFLGIDTSNYTTSVSAFCEGELLFNLKAPLPVKDGECGLRQSDALFAHVKNLPSLFEEVRARLGGAPLMAVGVSAKPRNAEGSYMPCFLAGVAVAQGIAASADVPLYHFSHQCGHLRAALYSSGMDALVDKPFGAFHISGGTTELLLVTPDGEGFHTEIVGGTLDLNAGQLVDRIGVMLGLRFPAGPALEKLAQDCSTPPIRKPVRTSDGFIHLSGVENLARAVFEKEKNAAATALFVEDHLARAVIAMSRDFRAKHPLPLVYAGGVMSNAYIKNAVLAAVEDAHFAEPAFSADNAVGIALLTAERFQKESALDA